MTQPSQQSDAFIFGSQPLGYYGLGVENNWNKAAKTDLADLIIEDLQEKYGTRLEHMEQLPKLAFRAALVTYLYQMEVWAAEADTIPENLIDEAIDRVCPDFWEDKSDLCSHLQEIATLNAQRIEALVEALTSQLRHDRKFTHKEWA